MGQGQEKYIPFFLPLSHLLCLGFLWFLVQAIMPSTYTRNGLP
jgi:hypothetical protein